MRYYIEKYYPPVVSFALVTWGWIDFYLFKGFHELMCKIADNALSISVTLLGFFLTILTIINAIDTRRMRFVKQGNKFQDLIGFLRNAITLNLLLIGASFIFKYFDTEKISILFIKGRNCIDFGYLFLFLLTMLASFRFTSIFVSLLTDPDVDRKGEVG